MLHELNTDLNDCFQIVLEQPLKNRQTIPNTDASFNGLGSIKIRMQSFCINVIWLDFVSTALIKYSIYAKGSFCYLLRFYGIWTSSVGIQLQIKCTDRQEICHQIFHTNIFQHSPRKGCDFCFKFVPEHTTGTRNTTASYLSSFEVIAVQEIDLTIRVKIHV